MGTMTPGEAFAPGELIREELGARGWTQADLAEIMGRPLQLVNELVAGKRRVTPETARGLSAAFATSAQFWLNMEAAYQLSHLTDRNDDAARKKSDMSHGFLPRQESGLSLSSLFRKAGSMVFVSGSTIDLRSSPWQCGLIGLITSGIP